MNEQTIVITEKEGKYSLENNGIADFALIGILECLLHDLKSANRRAEISTIYQETVQKAGNSLNLETTETVTPVIESLPDAKSVEIIPIQNASAPDIKTRIKKATEAIRGLGGEVENLDLTKMSDAELQAEFDELTNRYKRLKTSQTNKKPR